MVPVQEAHGDCLVVVGDHVLEEPDVRRVARGAVGCVVLRDAPADRTAEHGCGDHQRDPQPDARPTRSDAVRSLDVGVGVLDAGLGIGGRHSWEFRGPDPETVCTGSAQSWHSSSSVA